MFVYVVHHTRQLDAEAEDAKLVGVFSSESAASAAVSELSVRPSGPQRRRDRTLLRTPGLAWLPLRAGARGTGRRHG
jgi:hypothetical protein